jgi:hypothetical protein
MDARRATLASVRRLHYPRRAAPTTETEQH